MTHYPRRTRGLERHDPKPAAPISLHVVSTREISDQDLGLAPDRWCQRSAELMIQAAIARRRAA